MSKERDKGIIIEPGVYDTKTLLNLFKKEFRTKVNGNNFTTNDIYQYVLKGFIPHSYGGNILKTDNTTIQLLITVTGKRQPHISKDETQKLSSI